MKKRIIISFAALLIVGARAIYAFGSKAIRLDAPTQGDLDMAVSQAAESAAQQAAELLAQSSAAQVKELEDLRQQVEQLNETLAETEDTATPPPVSEMQVVQVSSPASAESKPIAVPVSQTPSSAPPVVPAPAKQENAGTVFEGHTVTVTDKSTPAVLAGGIDWPITKLYFFSAGNDYLGSISGAAYKAIMNKYKVMGERGSVDAPGSNGDWEYWFAERFNEYWGLSNEDSDIMESRLDTFAASVSNADTNFDAAAHASEAFALVNEERVKNDLCEVEMNSIMMERAELRAKELEEKYDHVRPDRTRMSTTYKCAEIINRRADTATVAVSSWMDSSGHKDIILKEKYNSAGIGCYTGEDGTVYWCMLFSK